jgi:nitrogen regulatory protein PII
MDIEPEKEIVLILSKKENTDAIVTSIREQLKLEEPGNGILYIQDVNRTYGLYK